MRSEKTLRLKIIEQVIYAYSATLIGGALYLSYALFNGDLEKWFSSIWSVASQSRIVQTIEPSGGEGSIILFVFSAFFVIGLLCLALANLVAMPFYGLSKLEEIELQKARDAKAQELYEDLPRKTRPYCLYLRGFDSTGEIKTFQASDIFIYIAKCITIALLMATLVGTLLIPSVVRWRRVRHLIELEELLAQAAEATGELVGLGRHGEHAGAGRIEVDDDEWQLAVSKLVEQADLIFLIPHHTPGTLWEVEQMLDSDNMHKLIVVKPPNRTRLLGKKYDPGKHWPLVADKFQSRNYELPSEFSEDEKAGICGRLFFFGGRKVPIDTQVLKLDDVNEFLDEFSKFRERIVGYKESVTQSLL